MGVELGGRYVPPSVPGADLTHEDMERVCTEDFEVIRDIARRYCRAVDATRSRKRMDRSATVVRDGHAPYGTDDVSDDVTQDAVLLYAARLRRVELTCERTRDDDGVPGWNYRKRNGEIVFITGETLRYWAIRDAAARNGYRVDVPPSELDATPGAGQMRPRTRAEYVATGYLRETQLASVSDAVFRSAWGDGSDFPLLRDALDLASQADDLCRAAVFSEMAHKREGGRYGAWRAMKRTREAAVHEWRELSERCDTVRDAMTGRDSDISER